MPQLEVLKIDFTNGKVQSCIVKVDNESYTIEWKDSNYVIVGSKGILKNDSNDLNKKLMKIKDNINKISQIS